MADPDLAPGAIPSPNIWNHPQVYEVENRAVDRAGAITALMRSLAPWDGRDLLDIGCGTGFHLPLFAAKAGSVVGVEPHGDLAAIARRRVRRLPNVTVLHGSAEALPLPDASVDVMHARWAYFFGPGLRAGTGRARPGDAPGVARVRDRQRPDPLDVRRLVPARATRRSTTSRRPRSGPTCGWERHGVDMAWTFDSREDLESVVRIEFAAAVAEEILAGHEGTSVDYAVNVWTRTC